MVKQGPVCVDFCHSSWSLFSFSFFFFIISVCLCPLIVPLYYTLTPLSSSLLSVKLSSSLSVSCLCLSFTLSLSFLHHKHFQRWHTRVDSHLENSATTIMSMLSSHNNARITCWGRQALLGAGSQTWLPWIESVNTTQTCSC